MDRHALEPPHRLETWLAPEYRVPAPRLAKAEEGGDAGSFKSIGLVATAAFEQLHNF